MLAVHERKRRFRDPERTRERLLHAAFREVHRSGFQSAGIDTILAATNVTKGALYHHFDSKEALGYAIVEEIVAKLVRDRWLRPLLRDGQPIDILIGIVRRLPARPADVRAGCPLLNLAQEMSPLDEQFRKRLERIFLAWQDGVATLLRKGQSRTNCSTRLESRRSCQLSDRDGRGLRLVSKECSRCEGVASGDHKYRGVAEVSSGASSISARGTTCHESRSRQRVASCSWIWPISWQYKPKVITFRCNTGLIPTWCTSPSRPWRKSSNPSVLFASTARSS